MKEYIKRWPIVAIALTMILGVAAITAPSASAADAVLCAKSTDFHCLNDPAWLPTGYTGQEGTWLQDKGHNCTQYVAYRLSKNGAKQPWSSPMGNALDWDDRANAAGYQVNKVPMVGSIIQWNPNPATDGYVGSLGHVAYVDAVTATTIDISEDAYTTTGGYAQRRRLDRNATYFKTANFIHIRDVTFPRPGDVDMDGHVNSLDLSAVISRDGQGAALKPNYTRGDFNHDYQVGSADLGILLANWTW